MVGVGVVLKEKRPEFFFMLNYRKNLAVIKDPLQSEE